MEQPIRFQLSLLDNAYDSFAESLRYVGLADEEPTRWKYAVLHLVHTVELMLKQKLADEHPLLIWQDIDRPGRQTVGLEKTVDRLRSAGIVLSDDEVLAVRTAVKWRNNITHYEVDLVIEEVRENYLLIYELLDEFHASHFGDSLSHHIPDAYIQTAMDLAESFKREFITFRGRQMHRKWARKLVAAQRVHFLTLDGIDYPRYTWGSEPVWSEDWMKGHAPDAYCRDCGTAQGEYHGPGCVLEECPRTGGQLFGCECDWEPSELWGLDDDLFDEGEVTSKGNG